MQKQPSRSRAVPRKKVFWNMLQIYRGLSCRSGISIKQKTLLKSHSGMGDPLYICWIFSEDLFMKNTYGGPVLLIAAQINPLVFTSLFSFFTPWKYQKTKGFYFFSKGCRKKLVIWNWLIHWCQNCGKYTSYEFKIY